MRARLRAVTDAGFDETVAILGGTGDQGLGLALRFAKAGRPVAIGSRKLDRALAAEAKSWRPCRARIVGAIASAPQLVVRRFAEAAEGHSALGKRTSATTPSSSRTRVRTAEFHSPSRSSPVSSSRPKLPSSVEKRVASLHGLALCRASGLLRFRPLQIVIAIGSADIGDVVVRPGCGVSVARDDDLSAVGGNAALGARDCHCPSPSTAIFCFAASAAMRRGVEKLLGSFSSMDFSLEKHLRSNAAGHRASCRPQNRLSAEGPRSVRQ